MSLACRLANVNHSTRTLAVRIRRARFPGHDLVITIWWSRFTSGRFQGPWVASQRNMDIQAIAARLNFRQRGKKRPRISCPENFCNPRRRAEGRRAGISQRLDAEMIIRKSYSISMSTAYSIRTHDQNRTMTGDAKRPVAKPMVTLPQCAARPQGCRSSWLRCSPFSLRCHSSWLPLVLQLIDKPPCPWMIIERQRLVRVKNPHKDQVSNTW